MSEKPNTEPLSIFPTLDNVQDVIELAVSQTPPDQRNQTIALLGTYHNTLLNQLKK